MLYGIYDCFVMHIGTRNSLAKECNVYNLKIICRLYQGFTPTGTCKSLNHLIPILKMYFLNNGDGKDFLDKSPYFSVSHDDNII